MTHASVVEHSPVHGELRHAHIHGAHADARGEYGPNGGPTPHVVAHHKGLGGEGEGGGGDEGKRGRDINDTISWRMKSTRI